ncbi:BREX-2 system phosphatase PglZ [Gordonia sp. NPDC003504]
MTALTATRPIIAARLAQAVDKRYRSGVLGLRASASWRDGTFNHDGVPVTVAACPSTLAVWEAIESRKAGQWLVILTPLDEKDLGDGVLAHLIDNRLLTPDPWAALRSMFSANTIEPALYRVADDRALAVGLLAAIPTTAVTPAPGGVLTRAHAMSALARGALRVTDDPHVEIDGLAILEWSLRHDVADDMTRLQNVGGPQVMGAVTTWLAECAGRLATVVAALLASERIHDLVPLGLVAGLVAAGGADTQRAQGLFLGRFGVTGLDATDLTAWAQDTSGLAVGQLDVARRHQVLQAAAAHVDALGISDLARTSELLPHGLTARFDALADAMVRALPDDAGVAPSTDAVAAVEEAWQHVKRHLLAEDDASLAGAEATVRALRWLAKADNATGDLQQLTDRYVQSGAWVDAALVTAHRGVDHRGLVGAVSRVIERASATRRVGDRRFAAALADTEHPSGLVVEDVLAEVVVPLAKQTPTLFVVVDALSVAAAITVIDAALHSGWSEAGVGQSLRRTGALAVLPTLTGRSRCSLLSGELRAGTDTAECAGFLEALRDAGLQAAPGRVDPIFHKKALDTVPAGADLATDVADAIADPAGRPLVAAVLNYVDDTLHHTDPGGTDWTLSTITHLRALLRAAQRAGRAVVLTSDHGHIIERRTSVKVTRTNLYGQRAHGQLDHVGDGEVLIRGPRVLTDNSAAVLAVDDTIRYGPINAGYHGGGSPAEVVVPVLALYTGGLPPTLQAIGAVEPDWWHTPATTTPTQTPAQPPATAKATSAAPTLFDDVDDEPSAPESGMAVAQQVLDTTVFSSQWRLAGRIVVSTDQVAALVDALLRAPAHELTLTQTAATLGVAENRVTGALLQIKRVLDVEGYEVLALDGPVVRLDEHMLREQFGVAP